MHQPALCDDDCLQRAAADTPAARMQKAQRRVQEGQLSESRAASTYMHILSPLTCQLTGIRTTGKPVFFRFARQLENLLIFTAQSTFQRIFTTSSYWPKKWDTEIRATCGAPQAGHSHNCVPLTQPAFTSSPAGAAASGGCRQHVRVPKHDQRMFPRELLDSVMQLNM